MENFDMSSASPEPITDKLFERLFPSLEQGMNLLGEFEVFSIIRDAKKIPVEDESLTIQGMGWIVLGDIEKGSELCERALSINSSESAIWINYAVAIGQKGLYAKQREILKRGAGVLLPSLMIFDFITSSFWADYEEMYRVKDLFKSLGDIELSDKQKGDFMGAEVIYDTLGKMPTLERSKLSEMASLAMQVLENNCVKARNCGQYVAPDGMLSFNYDVSRASSDLIIKLNDELASKIVENNLFDAESIVLFTPGD
ncbi:hypothetical protein FDW94_07190 [Citrobacter sp. wls757]|uniref:hypothetical protein n=1 Tax=Citrobacter sp. wls757 TaxID=2576417 RepID=UPI0010CA2025|nr:hypothetical protein [Citrobacter sp. wls757]TKU47852.1 hypothetical protein FDW94_07190 [Citrobacter sp. wls757]